jgi:tetratricopeptide (TPR) repeat protein
MLAAQNPPAPGYAIQVTSKSGDTSTIDQGRDPLADKTEHAAGLIKDGKPADAVAILDEVIGAEEATHKGDQRMMFAARSLTEAIVYSAIASRQKESAVVLDETWALAYFLKGFALVDLNRGEEAKAYFDRALGMAPMNAQYLAERGEWHKARKDWTSAYADFESASNAAEFSPDEQKSFEKRRALHGMAFVRTEQRQLNEAEKLLRQCLKIDPSDTVAKHELEYIKSLR